MAIINSVVMGKSRKSIGNVTLQVYGGQTIGREKPVSVKNPRTPAQLVQRDRMRNLVAAWRNQLVALKAFFTARLQKQSEFNAFIKANMPYADAPWITEAGGIETIPVGAFLSSGKYPEHMITVSEVTDDIAIQITNPAFQADLSEGDIIAVVSVENPSGNLVVEEYPLTEANVTALANGEVVVTDIEAPTDYNVIWYSPSKRLSSTARMGA